MKLTTKEPKNLLNATKEERQIFLDSFDYVLTDCDCTIWGLFGPYEGANVAVEELKASGKRVVFVSNNSIRSEEEYNERFRKYNFNANFKNDLINPTTATIDYLHSLDFKGSIFCIGSLCFKNMLTQAGFELINDDCWSSMDGSIPSLLSYVNAPAEVSAVIVDTDFNLNMKQLIRAQIFLRNKDCIFIAGTADMEIPFAEPVMGPGPFLKILEEASKRKAMVVGKPGAALCEVIIGKFKITDTQRVLFVGDMLTQDIGFGNNSGFQTLAVLTSYSEEQVLGHSIPNELPDFYLPSFADFNQVLIDLKKY